MNHKLTTALSVVGVLSAGTAAAAVNTTILDRPTTESAAFASAPSATTPSTTATTPMTPPTTASPASTIDIEVVTVTTPAPATTPVSTYLTTFNVGDAGTVTVDVVDGGLSIVDLITAPGWSSSIRDTGDPTAVEANFASATVQVTFSARFVDGEIIPDVVSSSTTAAGAQQPATAQQPSSGGEYDDNDEYEDDDDHDDDEDHDEYEGGDHDDDDRDEGEDDRDD